MVKHLTDLLTTPTPQGAAADPPRSYEDAMFDKLKDKFPLIIFSCVQLSSKMSLHSHVSSVVPTIYNFQYPVFRNEIISCIFLNTF